MEDGQITALNDMLNFCRRAKQAGQVDVREWQRVRDQVNRALSKPGPPAMKPPAAMISDLERGVPVAVAAKRYKVSRGTVYGVIKHHPELAKLWEEKRKKKRPDPVPGPVPDPAPVRPTTPPLPDVLLQFLAAHKPTIASSSFPMKIKRTALRNVLSQLGLVRVDEFDALPDEELVIRVTAYQGQSQPDEARLDLVEPPPPEASGDGPRIRVSVRDMDDWLVSAEAAKVIAEEIAQNLEPFAEMDPDHEFFVELPRLTSRVTKMLMLRGSDLISDCDIPEIAKWAVGSVQSKMNFPPEVLAFAGLSPQGGGQPGDQATTGRSPQAILSELLAKHEPKAASGKGG